MIASYLAILLGALVYGVGAHDTGARYAIGARYTSFGKVVLLSAPFCLLSAPLLTII